jgi:tRNA uridine 5-carbamoylmethylation protein Kti12
MQIIVMQGLPGSGKSTIARNLVGDSANKVIISKDAIRRMFGDYWQPEREPLVAAAQQDIIFSAMMHKVDMIVIDSCNFGQELEVLLGIIQRSQSKLCTDYAINKMEVVTPVKTCIERVTQRDANEPQPINEQVIYDMIRANDIDICKLYDVPIAELCKQHGIHYRFDHKDSFTIDINDVEHWHSILWNYLLSQEPA